MVTVLGYGIFSLNKFNNSSEMLALFTLFLLRFLMMINSDDFKVFKVIKGLWSKPYCLFGYLFHADFIIDMIFY